MKRQWPISGGIVFWSVALMASTCIEPKPLPATELCGRVVDPAGANIPDVELQLLDVQKNVAASAHSDEKGNFTFSELRAGDYRLTTKTREPGFQSVYWPVRVTKPRVTANCRRPLLVQVAPWSCGSSVSMKGYRP